MGDTSAVHAWDQRFLAQLESTFGTYPDPLAAGGIEFVNLNMGPVEKAVTRAKKDKTLGRDETLEFVHGRFEPIAFDGETSVKSRASATTAAKERALMLAGGLVETVGGSNVTYGLSSDPTVQGLSIFMTEGASTAARLGEIGYGGLVKQLTWSGGDKELMLKAAGAFVGKEHQGQANVTFVDGSTTAGTFATVAHAYRFGLGYYQVESEIIKVTAIDYATGGFTATRAQLASTGAAHTAAAAYPYIPAPTLAGSPISEAAFTATIGGITYQATKFNIDLTTGMEHLPAGAGSARRQGGYAKRVAVKGSFDLFLKQQDINLLGKTTENTSVAVSLVCGSTAGGIVTFSMPTCQLGEFAIPAPGNDGATVSVPLMVRGSSGNDSLLVTYS